MLEQSRLHELQVTTGAAPTLGSRPPHAIPDATPDAATDAAASSAGGGVATRDGNDRSSGFMLSTALGASSELDFFLARARSPPPRALSRSNHT